MTDSRDSTRIVRSWLESGSTGIPDHVLDAAMAEVRSTPQRRRWSPWRAPMLQTFLKLAAAAAIGVAAIAVTARVLSPSGVAAPSPGESGEFGGSVTFTRDGSPQSIEIDAVADGLSLSGTAVIDTPEGVATLNLACARLEGGIWMLAGTYASTAASTREGENGAVIVADGTPQRVTRLMNSDIDPFGPCEQFVMELALAELPPDAFAPVTTGSLTLPPAP